MSNKHCNSDERPDTQSHYRTGDTHHKKSNRAVLAVLLVVVIFCGGMVTAFNLLNIHLFKGFGEAAPAAVSLRFSKKADTSPSDTQPLLKLQQPVSSKPLMGATVQQLSSFDQLYYRLPSGLYVTKVDPNTQAAAKGLIPGDILIRLDGQRLTDADTLQHLLAGHHPGDLLELVVYRGGAQHTVELIFQEAD